jgi:hypothetical protein
VSGKPAYCGVRHCRPTSHNCSPNDTRRSQRHTSIPRLRRIRELAAPPPSNAPHRCGHPGLFVGENDRHTFFFFFSVPRERRHHHTRLHRVHVASCTCRHALPHVTSHLPLIGVNTTARVSTRPRDIRALFGPRRATTAAHPLCTKTTFAGFADHTAGPLVHHRDRDRRAVRSVPQWPRSGRASPLSCRAGRTPRGGSATPTTHSQVEPPPKILQKNISLGSQAPSMLPVYKSK